jgi:hypothetical protein
MTDLAQSIRAALDWCEAEGAVIPLDIYLKARQLGVYKASGDLPAVGAEYNDRIAEILIGYFEGGGSVAAPRNQFRQAAVEALGSAYDLGWTDGGGAFPMDDEALSWLNTRIEQEMAYIGTLFEQAKELRKEEDFDFFAWITQHAASYARTLRELYNVGRVSAMKDKMVTFAGEDGAESCPDCQELKGKRHRISWFVARDFVPPFGHGLECHPGRRCEHYLEDDQGNPVTI